MNTRALIRLTPVAVAAALVAGASLIDLPGPAAGVTPETQEVSVTPQALPLACPGPLEVPVGSIDAGDSDLDAGSDDIMFTVSPEGTPMGDGTAVSEAVASQVERVGGGDIGGLAGLSCTSPSQDQWLVAGSTSLGSSARLVLSNPSEASVRVQVSLHGPVGQLADPTSITLGPGSQQSVLLEGVEAEVPALAVHVVSGGVGVSAGLQDSRLDGFVAAGTDWASPTATSTDQVVLVPSAVTEDAPGTLRVSAPEGADLTLTLLGADGTESWLGGTAVSVDEGAVTDIALPAGDVAAVRVESSTPVAAAAMVTVAREAPADAGAEHALDLAWTEGQSGTDAEQGVVVPDGALSVVAASATATHLTLTDESGEAVVDADIPAGHTVTLPVEAPAGTVLTSTDDVAWTLRVTDADAGFVTTLSPEPTTVPDRVVSLVPGPYVGSP
ncbi:DUF5719 family protein [Demequina sp. NBRC 110057]|uniref:DUF5719 family protein n=1 Tax=Demequina sp. NBRC 110057 TaxID=1570346 RepID=UPI0009FE788A|nr:DUF5719 family protein [Demequina sp. NBRC 110057]